MFLRIFETKIGWGSGDINFAIAKYNSYNSIVIIVLDKLKGEDVQSCCGLGMVVP